MIEVKQLGRVWPLVLAVVFVVGGARPAHAQAPAQPDAGSAYHQIDGRVQFRTGGRIGNVRVRLLRLPDLHPVGETFSRPKGNLLLSK